VRIGRRRLVRRTSLAEWIASNERCYDLDHRHIDAVGA
jgi:hypothetical protein